MFFANRTTTFFVPIAVPFNLCSAIVAPATYFLKIQLIRFLFHFVFKMLTADPNAQKKEYSPTRECILATCLPMRFLAPYKQLYSVTYAFTDI